jgi:molecular chaperone DnaJ
MDNRLSGVPDYYKILNIPFGSAPDLIKKTYRNLAKIYHPDNKASGCSEKFLEIHTAYSVLSGINREKYDFLYKITFTANYLKDTTNSVLLPSNRIVYTSTMSRLAKMGLMKTGLRNKDRRKFTGIFHDLDLLIKKEEIKHRILVRLPLTVRILCPNCMGSNIYCDVCLGIGTYKSSRLLQIAFEPHLIQNGKIYELELSRFRPDNFIHFKKKFLKIKLNVF